MPNWSTISNPKGVYISPIYSVSNALDRYVTTINIGLQNPHDQQAMYYFRVSYDTKNWTEWKKFYDTSYDLLDEHKLSGLYFQYKVVLISESLAKAPFLQSFELIFKPFAFIDNVGDLETKPKIWIRKVNGKGNIKIINHTTGQEVEFTDLLSGEEVYVDCENEEIVSSHQDSLSIYRYDNHNDEFLELIRGDNYITSEGDFDLDIRYKGILLQE